MSRKSTGSRNSDTQHDEDIRRLVVERLRVLSSDEAVSVGVLGSFTRDEMIEHVQQGDEVGRTLEAIEINWMRSLKEGQSWYANDRDET